jgi:hypothetical protein
LHTDGIIRNIIGNNGFQRQFAIAHSQSFEKRFVKLRYLVQINRGNSSRNISALNCSWGKIGFINKGNFRPVQCIHHNIGKCDSRNGKVAI